ncbi:hypothetical protein AGMMS49938_09130 [Fibrobacterales bacterium]|nr:hypothetical protein AGMMS49938_09130 [Fibrobacterales bacterium]
MLKFFPFIFFVFFVAVADEPVAFASEPVPVHTAPAAAQFAPAAAGTTDRIIISQIYITPGDVFDDAATHSPYEKKLYEFGNYFHIETRESIIRARLPFEIGDTVSIAEIQEAEKNLRSLTYLSDAKIEIISAAQNTENNAENETALYITTSDNWTFSPAFNLGKPGEEWLWSIGLIENNLLGFGHTVGFFFEHQEDRDQKYLLYQSGDFIFPHHSFNFLWSENSDGYSRSIGLAYPFISRAKNGWAYNTNLLWSKRKENFYESKNPTPIYTTENLKEDSLEFNLRRSFGGTHFKTYLGASYNFHKIWGGEVSPSLQPHIAGDNIGSPLHAFSATPSSFVSPNLQDSRLGISFAISRIHLQKRYNLHKVKWAEDLERGYYLETKISKNFEQLNAGNRDFYFEHAINLSLGTPKHNFYLKGKNSFYYNDTINNMSNNLFGEYIYKPNLKLSSVLNFQIDSWQKTDYLHLLYLDANNAFPGFPSHYLAGENTFIFKVEQRYFPNFEILTQIPSFAIFATAGEATDRLRAFEPRNLQYEAGLGLRVSSSKSVQSKVVHLDISFPLNGELRNGFKPRFSFIGKVGL